MIKKLEKILNCIDETKTESLIDAMKWCIDNDCWVPTYHAIISGY